jgi:hypothetical protein
MRYTSNFYITASSWQKSQDSERVLKHPLEIEFIAKSIIQLVE